MPGYVNRTRQIPRCIVRVCVTVIGRDGEPDRATVFFRTNNTRICEIRGPGGGIRCLSRPLPWLFHLADRDTLAFNAFL